MSFRTDGQILAEFAKTRSEEAFAEIVKRHGRMVYNVCLRITRRPEIAEEAAQGAFLVLARKAAAVVSRPNVGAWLHRVAANTARRAGKAELRRRTREKEAGEVRERKGSGRLTWSSVEGKVDDALMRLPESQRAVVVGIYLEDRSRAEVAAQLGLPEGTVASRCSAALEKLRRLLGKRGASVGAATLAGLLAENALAAEVPASLSSLPALAASFAAKGAAGGSAVLLAEGAMKAMMIAKIKTAAAVICAVTVLGLGGGAAYQLAAAEPKPTKVEKGEKEAKAEKKLNPKIMAMKDNTWLKMNPKKEPAGRNYSGACLGDWGQGARIFYFGGGHVSYDGDDVVLYDPVANTWTSQYEPERYSNKESLRDSEYQPRKIRKTGRPAPHHTYQRVCWVPDRKVFFYVSYDSVWEFDPARAKWRPLAGKYSKDPSKKIPKARAAAWHAFYSPELKAPVGIVRGGNGGVYTFDYKKAEWTRKGARKGASVVGETYSTQIPSLGVQLISGSGKGFWTYEFKTGKLKKLEGIPEALLAGLAGCQALAYDSANDVVIAMPRMPRVKKKAYKPVPVWKLDPKTMKWTELKPEGAAPAGAAQWAPLWYDPDHNAFFFLNRRGQSGCETWAYRYKRKKESK